MLLAACGRRATDAERLLARIDSLADVNPDSADVLLKPTAALALKGRENEEVCKLLRIKTDDKLYRPVTHYRDTILQLIDYFEHHPTLIALMLLTFQMILSNLTMASIQQNPTMQPVLTVSMLAMSPLPLTD